MTQSGRVGRHPPFHPPLSRTSHLLKLEPKRLGEEDGHLSPRHVPIRAELGTHRVASDGDSRLTEGFDELEREVRSRHVGEGRRHWSRADLQLVAERDSCNSRLFTWHAQGKLCFKDILGVEIINLQPE